MIPTPERLDHDTLAASHALDGMELAGALGADPDRGLDAAGIDRMRERFGSNTLPEPKPQSRILLFLEQFNNPLIFVLFGAAILTWIFADPSESITIFIVVFFNAAIGYYQEQRASERLKAVRSLTAPSARVIRDGEHRTIRADEIVVGDVILLESGVRVPADLRLIETIELTIDESILTGETLPSAKGAGETLPKATGLGDRKNVAFAGTTVRRGRGRGLAIGIGEHSQLGRISRQVAEAETTQSPLQERLEKFGKVMAIGIGVVIGSIVAIGLLRGYEAETMLLTAVGLAVSAIPEGLPIAVTVALSIGVYQMARRSAIVRRLNAVETLGSTTVICSDKTGTLTRNEMTTLEIVAGRACYRVTGIGYEPEGEILDDRGAPAALPPDGALAWTLRIGLLCTESSFSRDESGARRLVGDPTEGAMIAAAEKAGMTVEADRHRQPRVVLPFESERMYMVTMIHDQSEAYYVLKGSAERIVAMCDRELGPEGIQPIELGWIEREQERFSARGLRVRGRVSPASPRPRATARGRSAPPPPSKKSSAPVWSCRRTTTPST